MITVPVKYYNQSEKDKFERSIFSNDIERVVSNSLVIEKNRLIANVLFHEMKDYKGWRTRIDLARRTASRSPIFDDYFSTDSGQLKYLFDQEESEMTEKIGVGLSISVFDEVLGTHEADWAKIGITQEKDLDYTVAATNTHIVAIECKGSILENPSYKSPTISNHKSSILKKKDNQRNKRTNTSLFGTISAISSSNEHDSVVWLIDPPIDDIHEKPKWLKVMKRITYYKNLISMFGTPYISIALSNRVNTMMNASSNIDIFDKISLVDHNGINFSVPSSFQREKTTTSDNKVSGIIINIDDVNYFIGMDNKIFGLMSRQDHDEIREWKSELPNVITEKLITSESDRQANGITAKEINSVDLTVCRSGFVIGKIQ